MSASLVRRLASLQDRLIQAVLDVPTSFLPAVDVEEYYRRQCHPLLSPPGWHLGHCVYIECVWIRGVLCGDRELERRLQKMYAPEVTSKATRGETLPPRDELIEWAARLMGEHRDTLELACESPMTDQIMEDNYLIHFLIHHHAQHLETLCMVRAAWHACLPVHNYRVGSEALPDYSEVSFQAFESGNYTIGGNLGFTYDNELPQHQVTLKSFDISSKPVSNAQYLAFVVDGGYRNPEFWSALGYTWLARQSAKHPARWHCDPDGLWFEITPDGPTDLAADSPVNGITRYEAGAFATWAGARLPHEFEWEAATQGGILHAVGEVWEWCANSFHSYPGFIAYPYREYSVPWFDSRHFVLRGGSDYSEEEIKRPSFRNYYLADAYHIFSGMRLAR